VRPWPAETGVGGSPQSAVRAARHGLPLTLAIIGGSPRRFRPFADMCLDALHRFKQPVLPIAVHSPGYVADTDEAAKNDLWPHYQTMMNRIGAERGWPPANRAHFSWLLASM
jgi:alkanesulfonate monooxygenase SsuD/methylene tetrahydromethanopterin reductase-like flavin-dependent oxidoreductase (luciferase family)